VLTLPDVPAPDVLAPPDVGADVDPGPLVDVQWGGSAVFHDASGNELGRATAPTKFPLPDGGSVTVFGGFETNTFLGVPAGATLAAPLPSSATTSPRQPISVDLTNRPGEDIYVFTGCGWASGPGTHLLSMDDSCLENDKAEIFAYSWASGSGAYIQVKDIAVGTSGTPLVVALPAWTPFPSGSAVRLDATGLLAQTTATVAHWAMRGRAAVMNSTATIIPSGGGNGTAKQNTLVPGIGTRWVRTIGYFPTNASNFQLAPQSYLTESLASPLVSPDSIDMATLLAMPSSFVATTTGVPTATFTAPSAGVDRVLVTFAWGNADAPTYWRVWAKPGSTEVKLPQIPGFAVTPPSSFLWVEVRAEDHPGVSTWAQVLAGWTETTLGATPDNWPLGRLSRAVWQP
jgi:hypothetical protein